MWHWQRGSLCHTGALALGFLASPTLALVSAQSTPAAEGAETNEAERQLGAALQQYFYNGANATSVNAGSAWFSHGADASSVAGSTEASLFFSQGANATSVNAPGQAYAPYFSNGAQITSVPKPQQPGGEYFSSGAQATSLPAPGNAGSAYFTNGAQATSWQALTEPVRARPATQPAAQPEQPEPQAQAPRTEPEAANSDPSNAAASAAEPVPSETSQSETVQDEEAADEAAEPVVTVPSESTETADETITGRAPAATRDDGLHYAHRAGDDTLRKFFDAFALGVSGTLAAIALLVAALSIGVARYIYRARRQRLH